jgi:DNA-directed RNA polymerase delta subunit
LTIGVDDAAARTGARTEDEVAAAEPDEDAPSTRSTRTEKLWADVRVDPVEIALPGGVGYTLRAYRSSAEIAQPEMGPATEDDLDDFDAASAAVARRRRGSSADDESDVEELDEDVEELDEDELDEDEDEDEAEEDEDEEDEEEEDEEDEEVVQDVPVFLGRGGRVFLFHSPDKLVEFVKSGAEHDLSQIDSWGTLVKRITSKDVVPLEDDTYELDLVVENLRGGPDAWDSALILKAGEIARDLSFALRIDPVVISLAAGSPLDDLDEALRSAEAGGIGSLFAKRKLRKIPAQQSSLAWRTIIGKISAAADWRD